MLKDNHNPRSLGRNVYRVIIDINRQNKKVDPYIWKTIQLIVEVLKEDGRELGIVDIARILNKGTGNIGIACLKATDLGLIVCNFKQVHSSLRSFYSIKRVEDNG